LEACGDRELRADDRTNARRERRLVKSWRTVHAIPIEQGERRVAEIGGPIDERLGQRRALQKTEGRCRMQFDVRGRHGTSEFRMWNVEFGIWIGMINRLYISTR